MYSTGKWQVPIFNKSNELGGAPGRLVTHCAEPSVSTSNFVVSSLEVVPWNRVSSSASGAEPLLPRVSFFGYDNLPIHINDDDNDSGVGLVTVDHSPSEVETIGRHFLPEVLPSRTLPLRAAAATAVAV